MLDHRHACFSFPSRAPRPTRRLLRLQAAGHASHLLVMMKMLPRRIQGSEEMPASKTQDLSPTDQDCHLTAKNQINAEMVCGAGALSNTELGQKADPQVA